jgi:O-antigen ligase
MPTRSLITAGLFLLAVLLAGYLVTHQGELLPLLLIAAIGATALILKPVWLVGLLVCAGASGVKLPGVSGLISMQQALFGVAAAYGIVTFAISKSQRPRDLSDWGLMVFGMALLLVMAVHGFGMRITGGSSYGGKAYIFLFLAILAYRGVQGISLSPRQARLLVTVLVAVAVIPAASQAILYRWPQAYLVLERFVGTGGMYVLSEGGDTVSERMRWQGMAGFSIVLWMFIVGRFAMTQRRIALYASIGIAIVLSLLSGFRSATGGLVVASIVVLIYSSRSRGMAVFVLLLVGAIAYMGLMVVGPHLPYTFQRALSYLPLIQWDSSALSDATGSWTWRLEVWQICMRHLPDRLLVGRGLLLEDIYQHAWLQNAYYTSPDFYYATHGYHSGPLSLLLDTGVLGLIGFLMLQIGIAMNGVRYLRRSAGSPDLFLRGYMLAMVVMAIYGILSYYLIFGDIAETLPRLVIAGILIRIVGEALVREKKGDNLPASPRGRVISPVPAGLGSNVGEGAAGAGADRE